MKTTPGKWLLWGPRIVALMVCAFLSLFGFDVFEPGQSLGQALLAFFMHQLPVLVLLLVVALAWRWEWIGGVVFTGLAMAYAVVARDHPSWIPGISGPLLTVGVLYFWSWRHRLTLHGAA
jgi:hypothetical protein